MSIQKNKLSVKRFFATSVQTTTLSTGVQIKSSISNGVQVFKTTPNPAKYSQAFNHPFKRV
ncbi:hypothetical protein [Wenyingzhuangia sp. 2_MG-2023]|uniref:hypothetical protein n=1 Tax=Wenyingzhuangia sp. 2_MG-2023 TaxID=3062639 RepID=UPI0026E2058A|nr:hypothetical protein [Wenyingzhuangia sp. 2_MG-2023]MDO6737065.1 hypothetical protein [Wenyingzhuangia sp. 2_MG-2023]